MPAEIVSQTLLSISGFLLSSGIVIGFWAWVRSQIIRLSIRSTEIEGRMEALRVEIEMIHQRCESRRLEGEQKDKRIENHLITLREHLEHLSDEFRNATSEMSRAVGRIEGFLKRYEQNGRVQT